MSLAERLADAAVHFIVTPIDAAFLPTAQKDTNRVLYADVVIDCTADDAVAEDMCRFDWNGPVTFVSVSVGLKARRMFAYVAHGNTFPADDFANRLDRCGLKWVVTIKRLGQEANQLLERNPRSATAARCRVGSRGILPW